MTKKLHPIHKMRRAFWMTGADRQDAVLARHVKPLLDALEELFDGRLLPIPLSHKVERLIAEWRAKP